MLLTLCVYSDEVVSLTNTEGKTVEVILIDYKDGEIKCRFKEKSKINTISKNKLNEASIDKVSQWKKEGGNFSTKIKTVKFEENSRRRNSSGKTLNPVITIKNNDLYKASGSGKIQINYLLKEVSSIPVVDHEPEEKKVTQTVSYDSILPRKSVDIRLEKIDYITSYEL